MPLLSPRVLLKPDFTYFEMTLFQAVQARAHVRQASVSAASVSRKKAQKIISS